MLVLVRIRCLVIRFRFLNLDHNWVHKICDSIKYLKSKKSGITDRIKHNFERIRIHSYNSLPVEEILACILTFS